MIAQHSVVPGVQGYHGVTLFFVISGFLITRLLLQERAASGRIGLRRFYARRLARLGPAPQGKGIGRRPPGAALIIETTQSYDKSSPVRPEPVEGLGGFDRLSPNGGVGFVIAVLSTVLFDGLHGGSAWLLFERWLVRAFPQWIDVDGYFPGTVGLLVVWLVFFAAFQLTCSMTAGLTGQATRALTARWVSPTPGPVAGAYNLCTHFTTWLDPGRRSISLARATR